MIKIFTSLFLLFSFVILHSQSEYKKFYYPSGQLSSEGFMVNEKPDGFWKSYYPNGIIKSEGKRSNYLLDSTWVFYAENADTIEKINYLNGKKSGFHIQYQSVQNKNEGKKNIILSKELYINDIREGYAYIYYSSGKIKEVNYYRQGKITGDSKEFNEYGKIITVYSYKSGILQNIEKINRIDNSGKKTGIWRDFYQDGKIKYETTFRNGQPQGIQKEYDPSGKLLSSLNFIEGNIDLSFNNQDDSIEIRDLKYDNGIIKSTGAYKVNTPIGFHKWFKENGELYYGLIYNRLGKVTSEGYLSKSSKRDGFWKEYYSNQNVKAEGDYKNNKKNGHWKYYNLNKSIEQEGDFSDDAYQNKWIWYGSNGKIICIENFSLAKEDGPYIEKNENGDTIALGAYSEGAKIGLWLEKEGGISFKGNYDNGYKNGIWKGYFENNALYFIGDFMQGNPNGKHRIYQVNQNLYETQVYSNGIKTGSWVKYNEDGSIKYVIEYKNDAEYMINGFKIEKIGK